MTIYVNVNAKHDGNGTKELPFRRINDAAKIAMPGDEILVAPGTSYRRGRILYFLRGKAKNWPCQSFFTRCQSGAVG